MKGIIILAVVAALMLAVVGGTAVAEGGSGKSGSGGGNSGKKMVTYSFFGTVTAVSQGSTHPTTGETTSPSVMVDVKKGNRAARDFAQAKGDSQTFNVASSTKIEVGGNDDANLADVRTGDEARVQVKASPTATTPLTARQIEVENGEDDSSSDS